MAACESARQRSLVYTVASKRRAALHQPCRDGGCRQDGSEDHWLHSRIAHAETFLHIVFGSIEQERRFADDLTFRRHPVAVVPPWLL